MQPFNLNDFISRHITNRSDSIFLPDIDAHTFELNEKIRRKSVLVIGGAGTIGSSFIKALLPFNPGRLVVVDQSENELTELTRDLRSDPAIMVPPVYKTYPLNFSNPIFYKMLEREGPFQIIANFAAHKHVRSEKDHYSIETMLENNVFQAFHLLEALTKHPPEHFFCVSTDKATNPVNVMGASKKLMEDVILSFSNELQIATARFANVAFSNGSLLDGYLKRIQKNQPLSCPSDVKRYFVSPQESGEICMLACMLGDSGDIYFPKLEASSMKNFKDITYQFISEMGWDIVECNTEEEGKKMASKSLGSINKYPVCFFKTDTSGEKLFEEFYTPQDDVDLSKFEALGIIRDTPKLERSEVNSRIESLRQLMSTSAYDKKDIVAALTNMIPDFEHKETGKSLDEKM